MKYLLLFCLAIIVGFLIHYRFNGENDEPVYVEHKEPYFIEVNDALYYVYSNGNKIMYCCDMSDMDDGKEVFIDYSTDPITVELRDMLD